MCKGTRCTHHDDPAVEYIEAPYDRWEFRRTDIYDQRRPSGELYVVRPPDACLIRVVGRKGYGSGRASVGGGPGHDQPMIRLKDDIGYRENFTDEQFRESMMCATCESVDGHGCPYCGRELTHMAVGGCPDCWWSESDERMIREMADDV